MRRPLTPESLFAFAICALCLTPLAAVDCGGSTDAVSSRDGGPATEGGVTCAADSIAFDLTIDSTGPVFLGGGQPPWPASLGCPGWLTITTAGGAPLVVSQGDCFVGCPASQPGPAVPQSFTWDGTYYPVPASCTACACTTPACAPPGNYVATFCVGYAAPEDAGLPETDSPTCKQIPFVWPPSPTTSSITETITPTPGGG
jgi:hypothetical protein